MTEEEERVLGVLDELTRIWLKYPHLRLGQLLINGCPDGPLASTSVLFYIENDKLISNIKKTLRFVEEDDSEGL